MASFDEYSTHAVHRILANLFADLMELGDHRAIKLAQETIRAALVLRQMRGRRIIKLDERCVGSFCLFDSGLRRKVKA